MSDMDYEWDSSSTTPDVNGPSSGNEYGLSSSSLLASAEKPTDPKPYTPSSSTPSANTATISLTGINGHLIPIPADGTVGISVATTFGPSSNGPTPTDFILVSQDRTLFYVHVHRLVDASNNRFDGLLDGISDPDPSLAPGPTPTQRAVCLPESAAALTTVLHAIYALPFSAYSPSFDSVSAAIGSMRTYGVHLETHLRPTSPLYTTILGFLPRHSLRAYAFAAEAGAHELAVACSAHLLSLELSSITSEIADHMGCIYLKKLLFLHLGRVEALKRLVLVPPYPHAPTRACSFEKQKELGRAWGRASATLAWEVTPAISGTTLQEMFSPIAEDLSCALCKEVLANKITKLVADWNLVGRTI